MIFTQEAPLTQVVYWEVLHPVELEFTWEMFWGEGKIWQPGEKPLAAEKNQQQT